MKPKVALVHSILMIVTLVLAGVSVTLSAGSAPVLAALVAGAVASAVITGASLARVLGSISATRRRSVDSQNSMDSEASRALMEQAVQDGMSAVGPYWAPVRMPSGPTGGLISLNVRSVNHALTLPPGMDSPKGANLRNRWLPS